MYMRLGTWTVRALYRSDPLKAVARELTQYMLGLVGVQVVRWDRGDYEQPHDILFYMEKGLRIII
jgi:hypothetical protein